MEFSLGLKIEKIKIGFTLSREIDDFCGKYHENGEKYHALRGNYHELDGFTTVPGKYRRPYKSRVFSCVARGFLRPSLDAER